MKKKYKLLVSPFTVGGAKVVTPIPPKGLPSVRFYEGPCMMKTLLRLPKRKLAEMVFDLQMEKSSRAAR